MTQVIIDSGGFERKTPHRTICDIRDEVAD